MPALLQFHNHSQLLRTLNAKKKINMHSIVFCCSSEGVVSKTNATQQQVFLEETNNSNCNRFHTLKINSEMVKKILMVCLGNTCRSPIAEAVMVATIKKHHVYEGWQVDSAAIANWHVGKEPNKRSLKIMKAHKLPYSNKARQIKVSDFYEFDYIFGMDYYNMAELNSYKPQDSKAKLFMLGDFGLPETERVIMDPYGTPSDAAFEKVYQQCVVACQDFLKKALNNEI